MRRVRGLFALALAALALAAAPAWAQLTCAPLTQGSASWTGIVNTYYPGTSSVASAGSTSIGVGAIDGRGAITPVAAGDLLLIVQVQDASISTSNSSAYGGSGSGQGYTSLNSSGLYEYAVATGPVSAGSIPLATALANSYHTGSANASDGQKRYQVIRVPQASSATLTGTLTAPPWDGNTGGIVAIDVAGNLNWNGQTIDVDGRGFRGGGGQNSMTDGTGAPVNASTDYVSNVGSGTLGVAPTTAGSVPNGAKGEGIAGTPIIVFTPTNPNSTAAGSITNTGGTDGISGGYPAGSFGRGAPGNGGGGGTDGDEPANDQNTGGAGGGNYGIGGKGGFGWTPGTPPGWDGGGFGGMSVPGGTTRLFFGGGGGAGSANNNTGTPGNGAADSGAPGGGMVFVRAGTTTSSATISARGTAGNTTVLNDASGGGGAGGSVLLFVNNGGAGVGATINIQGGNGGCNTGGGTFTGTCLTPTGGSPHGPGGGGSGGFAILSGNATVNAAGGAFGVTAGSATSTPDYGSTSSVGGFQIVSLTASQITGSGSSTACFPQLTVTKSTSTPFVAAGAPATYTITVSNAAGKSSATGVTLSDVLPANPNMTFASNSAPVLSGGSTRTSTVNPAVGATSPTWGNFTIPGGGSVALTFVASTLPAITPGVYQNPATVTYDDPTRTAVADGHARRHLHRRRHGGRQQLQLRLEHQRGRHGARRADDHEVVQSVGGHGGRGERDDGHDHQPELHDAHRRRPRRQLSGGHGEHRRPRRRHHLRRQRHRRARRHRLHALGRHVRGGHLVHGHRQRDAHLGGLVHEHDRRRHAHRHAERDQPGKRVGHALHQRDRREVVLAQRRGAGGGQHALASSSRTRTRSALTLANPGLTDSFPANLVASGGAVTVSGAGCTGFAPAAVVSNATGITLTAGTLPASSQLHGLVRGPQRGHRHLQQHDLGRHHGGDGNHRARVQHRQPGRGPDQHREGLRAGADRGRRHLDAHLHAHQPDGRGADQRHLRRHAHQHDGERQPEHRRHLPARHRARQRADRAQLRRASTCPRRAARSRSS